MNLANLFKKTRPQAATLPGFIRTVEDTRGIRILRLQGPVDRDIGPDVRAHSERLEREGDAFERPVLLDFADTTHWDFTTVSFLVDTLRRRMAASARVGIINVPRQLLAELEIARLEGLFALFASEEEALTALGTGEPPRQDEG